MVGQVTTVILVGFGLAWIPLMELISGQLYKYLQSVQAYIAPPIAAVFLIGVAWKRVNAKGAIASLIAGFVLGMGRLVAELYKSSLGDGFLYTYATVNFLHFAFMLFIFCSLVLIVVSLVTSHLPVEQIKGLTFQTVDVSEIREKDAMRRTNIFLTIVLIAAVVIVWLYFTG